MKAYLILILSVLVLMGCGGSDDPANPPSNLAVSVDQEDGNTGKVTVSATADNAMDFRISFGYYTNEDPQVVTANAGQASFVYPFSGTYTITVTALGAPGTTPISETKEITVTKVYTGATSPETYAGMQLVWEDDFSGDALNTDDWTFEIGNGTNGWGNNELEYYRTENTSLVDGNLVITAKNEEFNGYKYTSSRIITKDKKTFTFGRIDIRAVIPKGQGIWPALWTLGNNISTVGWPACGEIDIMEMVGGSDREKTVHGTAHWQDVAGYAQYSGKKTASKSYSDDYHVYSIEWTAKEIIWYVDNVQFHVIDTAPNDNPGRLDEFRAAQFFIFNVAVGGNWPGAPDATTKFPQRMLVDYIRVFQAE